MPTSATLRPLMVNEWSLPWYVSLPSPQVTPMPTATDLLSMETFPEGVSCAPAVTAISITPTMNTRAAQIFMASPFSSRRASSPESSTVGVRGRPRPLDLGLSGRGDGEPQGRTLHSGHSRGNERRVASPSVSAGPGAEGTRRADRAAPTDSGRDREGPDRFRSHPNRQPVALWRPRVDLDVAHAVAWGLARGGGSAGWGHFPLTGPNRGPGHFPGR